MGDIIHVSIISYVTPAEIKLVLIRAIVLSF